MKSFVFALAIGASCSSFAGPFGIDMAMSVEQLNRSGVVMKKEKEGQYIATQVPKPHDAFESYQIWIDPKVGVCRVRAVGNTINTNHFGDQVKSQFDLLESQLKNVYGKSKKYDFLRRGSIWSDNNDWSMALAKDERSLIVFWDVEEGSTLKDGIKSLALQANGLSASKAYIDIVYEFENWPVCRENMKKRQSNSL